MVSKIDFNCSIDNSGGIFVVSGASSTPAPGIQGVFNTLCPHKPELQSLKAKKAFSVTLEKCDASFKIEIQTEGRPVTLFMTRTQAESTVGASLMEKIDPTPKKAPMAPKPVALPTPEETPVLSKLTILKGIGLVSGLATYYFSPMYGTALIAVSVTSLLTNCLFGSEEKGGIEKEGQNIDRLAQVAQAQLVSGTGAATPCGITQ